MKLSIESVNIINLRRRLDLEHAQQGAWQSRGCPPEIIRIFEAHDGLDYQSRDELAQAAVDDGFPFFNFYLKREEQQLQTWMGIGELACMWSIASLLREIAHKEGNNAHFYVLADRFLRKKFWEVEALINELPNFNFMQFRGYLPPQYAPGPVQVELYEQDLLFWSDRLNKWIWPSASERIKAPADDDKSKQTDKWIWPSDPEALLEKPKPRPPIRWYDESRGIEHNGLKIGDGLLLMTPEAANWMLPLADNLVMNDAPYELMLMHMAWEHPHAGPIPDGVYSMAGPVCSFQEWYDGIQWNYSDWEGQFDYKSVLGKSDIDIINETKGTQNK